MQIECDLGATVSLYVDYLRKHFPDHHRPFSTRMISAPESARAEAALFTFLREHCTKVEPHEIPGLGGVDFICTTDDYQFLVEVTALEEDSVARASGWSKEVPAEGGAFSFENVTAKIRQKVSNKAAQFRDSPLPRILVIATSHHAGNVLLGRYAAQASLLSDTSITIPVDNPTGHSSLTTDLQESVFIRPEQGRIVPCRQSISALLFVALHGNECSAIGALHPEPAKPFDTEGLPNVPFARFTQWPPSSNRLSVEWIVSSPKPATHQYRIFDFDLPESLFGTAPTAVNETAVTPE